MSGDDDDPNDSEVVSLSGQPIWHHDEEKPWEAPQGEMCLEQITEHIQAHVGPVAMVFHEVISDTVHIDVHHVPPADDHPFHTFVTSGMSDLRMTAPEGAPAHLELMICVPPEWQVSQEAWKEERWYWPIRTLKYMARFPHKHDTWLGYGHTLPNGDPPKPFADNTAFTCMIILPQIAVPDGFDELVIDDQKTIRFMYMFPIYSEEMELKLREGTDALLDRFVKYKTPTVVELGRRNVAKKRFGLF